MSGEKEFPRFHPDIPKIGDGILIKHEKGWVGNQIYKAQLKAGFLEEHAIYTHIATSIGGYDIIEVSPPKVEPINILDKYKGRYACIIKYKGDEYDTKKRYKVGIWASTHCNTKYDWLDVIRFKLRFIPHTQRDLVYCSENFLLAWQKEIPKILKEKKPHESMPADMFNPHYFRKKWEGILE